MALNAADLSDDIGNDSLIMDPIPDDAQVQFNVFIERLAVHITAQIERGTISDVTVNTETGEQNNTSNVQ